MSGPVIVNVFTNEVKTFDNVKEITLGRNVSSSIDIPSPYISRTQCILKLTENNEWSLTDLSRHSTTLLNDIPLQGITQILKNGDKISFLYYKTAEYAFYNAVSDVSNPAKKRKLEQTPDIQHSVDILTPAPIVNEITVDKVPVHSLSQEIGELNNDLSILKEKYDLALEEIDNQRRINESLTHKLNIALKESNDAVSILQNEKEVINTKLKEEEVCKENLLLEVLELKELLKESELEQLRLTEECKCKGHVSEVDQNDEQSHPCRKEVDHIEPVSASEADALQKLVEIVEIKWNEQEMEHMREELRKKDEKITDLTLQSQRHENEIVDAIDHEMLCSICNDLLYEATTLNCKHTFCKVCVVEWKKKKKECPVCRTKIKTETQPLVIDSFIDKIAETLGGELKTRRAEIREERASRPVKSPGYGSRRGGEASRASRRSRGNLNTISSAMSILQPLVIELADHFNPGMAPPPVIDLTTSPAEPRRRGVRRGRIGYYHS